MEPVELELKPGTTNRDVKLVASRGCLLEVEVRSQPDDRPVEGVRIACFADRFGGQFLTPASGVGSIRLPPGPYDLGATKTAWIVCQGKASLELDRTQRVTLRATLAPRLAGTVKDATGQPATNVWVNLFPRSRAEQRTDRRGRFDLALDGPPAPPIAGQKDFLIARDEARDLAASLEVAMDHPSAGLDITLQPGVTVAGRVNREKGGAISNAVVRLIFERRGGIVDFGVSRVTDSEGLFEIPGLPPGWRFQIEVSAKGHGTLLRALGAPEPGIRRLETDPIDLPAADEQVAGVVLDEAGKPAAKSSVYLSGPGQPQASTVADDAGRFLFPEVCSGPLQLSARRDVRTCFVTASGGETNVVLRFGEDRSGSADGHELTGRVLGPDGNGAASVRLQVFPQLGMETRATTDRDGRFRTLVGANGATNRRLQYTLIALDWNRELAASADLDEDTNTVTLKLEPAWTWTGRVVGPNGAGVSNLTVQLLFCGPQAARTLDAPGSSYSPTAALRSRAFLRGVPSG